MPTAVICSLFAGICAVIEFHHSSDYPFSNLNEKWILAAVSIHNVMKFCKNCNFFFRCLAKCSHSNFQIDATLLSFLHAIIAFALQ